MRAVSGERSFYGQGLLLAVTIKIVHGDAGRRGRDCC